MGISRRSFLKGLFLGAIATQVPFDLLTKTVDCAEDLGIDVLYVRPEDYTIYSTNLPPQWRFENSALADKGIKNLAFQGFPVVPYHGRIRNKHEGVYEAFLFKVHDMDAKSFVVELGDRTPSSVRMWLGTPQGAHI